MKYPHVTDIPKQLMYFLIDKQAGSQSVFSHNASGEVELKITINGKDVPVDDLNQYIIDRMNTVLTTFVEDNGLNSVNERARALITDFETRNYAMQERVESMEYALKEMKEALGKDEKDADSIHRELWQNRNQD